MPRPPKLHRALSAKLCAVLCSYRLCDVLYSLKCPRSTYRNPKYPRFNQTGLRPSSVASFAPGRSKLNNFFLQQWPLMNWVSTIRKARDSLDALQAFRSLQPGDEGPSLGIAGPSAADVVPQASSSVSDLQVKLFRELYSFWHQSSGAKILLNVQIAAIHLSFMLQGSKSNDILVCCLDFISSPQFAYIRS